MSLQKTILIVEDNPLQRVMLSKILESDHYQVFSAENGLQALELLRQTKETFSLILLDIMMPVMDGYSFLKKIREFPELSSIPIIVTTQHSSTEDEVTALSLGATDFVSKPYQPQIILHRIANIINLHENAAMVGYFQFDALTGLYRKEYFYQKARQYLLDSPDPNCRIICSDIENFKLINDIFGMTTGDQLLHMIAELFREQSSEHGICSRFHADQFLCLTNHLSDCSADFFHRLNEQINRQFRICNVSIKWGIYEITDRSVPVEQMCDRALLAANSIKGKYNQEFAFYDTALREQLLRERAIVDCMEQALADHQFYIELQPKYSLDNDSLSGAEALVRWQHPEWGRMRPYQFIPLFEKNGFITKLDQFVWEQTCAILRAWIDRGIPVVPISVNVSRADIYQSNLIEILSSLLERYRLPSSFLHLEITEGAYTEDPEQIVSTVSRLRELGFVIEMDDFGSGQSSLNMLNQMPLDILKLDMKFIQSTTTRPADQHILRFIMSLARWLGLYVIAEGVETRDQLEWLREIGCDYVQGYYFARPMPISDFEHLLKTRIVLSLSPTPNQPAQQKKPIILIINETSLSRELLTFAAKERYHLIQVSSTEEALALLRGNEYATELIILSLTLPNKSGFELLRQLRQERYLWKLPILAIASSDGSSEEQALSLGANDVITRPYTIHSLLIRAQRLLRVPHMKSDFLYDELMRDPQTGLLNRRGLHSSLEVLPPEDLPAALLLIDLDQLQSINVQYGSDCSKALLSDFSQLLKRNIRQTDILSRYSDDAFLIVLKRSQTYETAQKKGSLICQAAACLLLPNGSPASCTIGIALCEGINDVYEDCLLHAEQALQAAKKTQPGSFLLWTRPAAGVSAIDPNNEIE